jgi:hypothetical protein
MSKPESEQAAKLVAKEMRARDAAQAVKEYHAERLAISARTARLRALRLAKESAAPTKLERRMRKDS